MTVLTVCAMLLGTAARAEALIRWTLPDSLETAAARDLWYRNTGGNTACVRYVTCSHTSFSDHPAYARSGTYSGWVTSPSYPNAWISFGRPVRVPSTATSCTASLAVMGQSLTTDPVDVSIEVIQVSGWTYATRQTYPMSKSTSMTYRVYTAGEWEPTERDHVVRVVLPGDVFIRAISIDDLTVTCVMPAPRIP